MNMYEWLNSLKGQGGKKAIPIVTYPALCFMDGVKISDLVTKPELQAECIIKAARNMPEAAAAVTLMDLSVEAECFGARVRISDNEVPAVSGSLLKDINEAEGLSVPPLCGRTGVCLESVRLVKKSLVDRPVIAGVIGPFSLAGRLSDITEIMYYCYDEPEMLSLLLDKCSEFIINYIKALALAGADGVLLCEPLSGMLSPELETEFSAPFIKRICAEVQNESFIVIYHNCGNAVAMMTDSIASNGCAAFHFGNSVELEDMLKAIPEKFPVMGNIDPVGLLHGGTAQDVSRAVAQLCASCGKYPNFVLSSGCDVPVNTPWENILAMFS